MKLCSNGSDSEGRVNNGNAEDDYLHQLECLNTSVAEWISQHVQRNPLVDLTPIFRDYEAYLKSLDQKRKQLNNDNVSLDAKPVSIATVPIVTEAVQTSCHSDIVVSSESNNSDHVISSGTTAAMTTTGMIIIGYSLCYHGNTINRRDITRQ